jgi:hypothetical protein
LPGVSPHIPKLILRILKLLQGKLKLNARFRFPRECPIQFGKLGHAIGVIWQVHERSDEVALAYLLELRAEFPAHFISKQVNVCSTTKSPQKKTHGPLRDRLDHALHASTNNLILQFVFLHSTLANVW